MVPRPRVPRFELPTPGERRERRRERRERQRGGDGASRLLPARHRRLAPRSAASSAPASSACPTPRASPPISGIPSTRPAPPTSRAPAAPSSRRRRFPARAAAPRPRCPRQPVSATLGEPASLRHLDGLRDARSRAHAAAPLARHLRAPGHGHDGHALEPAVLGGSTLVHPDPGPAVGQSAGSCPLW